MATFPNTFAGKLQPLPQDMGDRANEATQTLAAKGYVVMTGVTRFMAGAVSMMAGQENIREFCYKDPTEKRFGTETSMERWLQKGGGRGMFLLTRDLGEQGLRLAGYGWSGYEENEHVPGAEHTFAVRIGKEDQRRGLAKPFSTLIVAGAAAVYGARDIWLDTWRSNEHAVGSYTNVGFEEVASHPGERLTAAGTTVPDERVYMAFPNELLPTSQEAA